jgi:hypothetical protein
MLSHHLYASWLLQKIRSHAADASFSAVLFDPIKHRCAAAAVTAVAAAVAAAA